MRTQKALEQAAAEIKRLRDQQRILTAGAGAGQKAAAEAAAGWEREREEVGLVGGWVFCAPACRGGVVYYTDIHLSTPPPPPQ